MQKGSFIHSLRMPDNGVSLHELLCALKGSQVMISQHDLHGIGTEKGREKYLEIFQVQKSSVC